MCGWNIMPVKLLPIVALLLLLALSGCSMFPVDNEPVPNNLVEMAVTFQANKWTIA